MSIYGSFTAKQAVAETLRTYLPAAVAAINSEDPADGLQLYVPTSEDIVTYALAGPGQAWPFPHRALFEVICEEATVIEWQMAEVSAGKLSQDHGIQLRVSVADTTAGRIESLAAEVELYLAACDRVLVIERNQLGAPNGIHVCAPVSVEFRNTDADKAVRQATRSYRVQTVEVNA